MLEKQCMNFIDMSPTIVQCTDQVIGMCACPSEAVLTLDLEQKTVQIHYAS